MNREKQADINIKTTHCSIAEQIKNKLKTHYKNNLIRARLKFIHKQSVKIKDKINFASNDYLGFACNKEITDKTSELVKTLGVGSGGSNLITGYHTIHQDLENEIAKLVKCEQVILFSSGFMANLALSDVLLNLDKENTIAIHDHNNHASLLDGSRLADCRLVRYKHNDLEHLDLLLKKYKTVANKYIFTESLFSMDGDFAKLQQISDIINLKTDVNNTCLIIDDSHGFGLFNNTYSNTSNINNRLIMGTFGKAIGCSGAFVAGPKVFIESIIQFARPYIYTTALSPILAASALHAIRLNQQTDEFRAKLFNNINYFCSELKKLDIAPVNTNSPIQPIFIGDAEKCIKASNLLQKNNIILTAIRAPTVANNKSRLRITLSAEHTKQDIDYLIKNLKKLKTELNL